LAGARNDLKGLVMKVLALETSTPYFCAAILELRNDTEIFKLEHIDLVDRAHAELGVAQIRALFEAAKLEPRADLIVVGTGPGSYTGVRVAASLGLGLARVWNAKIVGVPTLEAIAATREGTVAVSLDARRGNVYSAIYRIEHGNILETLSGVAKRSLEEFQALIPSDAIKLEHLPPSPLALARLGLMRFKNGEHELVLEYL
jgi:tRNA threonylcarbamoyladenosine biosynthesis protein TsaB